MRRRGWIAGLAAAAVLGLAAGGFAVWRSAGPTLIERPNDPGQARFDARALLGIADADMAGTAYADGVLHPQEGTQDHLMAVTTPGPASTIAWAPASNSVMGWPGALDVSPDGRFAYVVETRAPAEPGVDAYDSVNTGMPVGSLFTALDLSDPQAPRVVGQVVVGRDPNSVHVGPDGRFAIVSRKEQGDALAAVILVDGVPTEVRSLGMAVSGVAPRAGDDGALYVRLSPDGRTLAMNIANQAVQFARLEFDAAGLPVRAVAIGAPVTVGRWLTMLRWSVDGRHVITADVGWGPSNLGAAVNSAGSLISIHFAEDGAHAVASEAFVSLSPEGFEFHPGGDLLVTVNMERTYLPERLPFQLFGRRERSSLSLVQFDPDTGGLVTVDGPLAFDGVLPEDALFDVDGDMLAVAVYQGKRGDAAERGWIALFRLDRTSDGPRLIPTGQRIDTARGLHDLALLR